MSWKGFKHWNRILHRDFGFFFVGTTIIYGLSGLALNHKGDWNPNYAIEISHFTTSLNLNKGGTQQAIEQLVKTEGGNLGYKSHYYPSTNHLKVFLQGGSTLEVNTSSGNGVGEFLKRRPVFYEVNFLHYNPNAWWKWFSDLYSVVLIFFAISSFFMVRGKNGPLGRGGVYILLGIIIPIVFLMLFS